MKRSSTMLKLRAPALAWLSAAVLAGLVAVAGIGALEPDELRPGMDPGAIASVYTSHRSCSNSVFLEGPGFMSWDASLYNRSAKIEVRFDQGLARVILIRIFLEPGDDGADVVLELSDEYTKMSGPPEIGAGGRMRWVSGTLIVELAVEEIQGRRELRLVMSATS